MAKRTKPKRPTHDAADVLTDILIVQLAAVGVQQKKIRNIVGCDIHRVSRIARHVTAARRAGALKAE